MHRALVFGVVACGAPATPVELVPVPDRLQARPIAECEEAFAIDAHIAAFDLDVDREDAIERWLVEPGRVTIVDRACSKILERFEHPFFGPASDLGPSLATTRWGEVPTAKVSQLGATDRLPTSWPPRTSVEVFGYSYNPVFVLLSVGGTQTTMYGYDALFVICEHGTCRADSHGHVEHTKAPVEGCQRWRRAVDDRRPTYRLVRLGDHIHVEQSYIEDSTCGDAEPLRKVWRTLRL